MCANYRLGTIGDCICRREVVMFPDFSSSLSDALEKISQESLGRDPKRCFGGLKFTSTVGGQCSICGSGQQPLLDESQRIQCIAEAPQTGLRKLNVQPNAMKIDTVRKGRKHR
jgi:hypothetical protein